MMNLNQQGSVPDSFFHQHLLAPSQQMMKVKNSLCIFLFFSPAGLDATFVVLIGRIKKPALNRYRLSAGDNGNGSHR
jgi:hypothetical protein